MEINGKVKRIGFVSTRLAGTDGVSLETYKWVQVLERYGFECFTFAGELETPIESSLLEPLAHFNHETIDGLQEQCFGTSTRPRHVSNRFSEIKNQLKDRLYDFYHQFNLDMIIPENALAIPMNIPLGMAITEFLAETGLPCVAHHHDFSWERDRFLINGVKDYLQYAFPPALPNIKHVVINSAASRQLSFRRGISNVVIPNVFDFANPPEISKNKDRLRKELGFAPGEIMVLQPTRIVPRKWVERAVELVAMMKFDKPRLVISHKADDEGDVYVNRIREYASRLDVELLLIGDMIHSNHCFHRQGWDGYSIDDVYQACDVVAYPSGYEGFGNAFLETIYFKKPIVVNRYSIFIEDIEPLGFDLASFDTFVTNKIVDKVNRYFDPVRGGQAAEINYNLAAKHFSYEVLEEKLLNLINCFK